MDNFSLRKNYGGSLVLETFNKSKAVVPAPDENIDTEIEDAKNIIFSRVKEIVTRYNRDPHIKAKMRSDIDHMIKIVAPTQNEFDGFDTNHNVPKLVCIKCGINRAVEEEKYKMTLLIYDGSQYMRQALHKTIENIRKDLLKDKMITSLPGFYSSSTGDGDEGCIFIQFRY